jgi:predicted Zn-dependent protease
MKKAVFTVLLGITIVIQPVFLAGQGFGGAGDGFAGLDRIFDPSNQSFTPEDEYFLGRAVAANILATYRPYTRNRQLILYLNSICQTLVINSSRPEIFNGYHVMILDSPEYNAFATPGGHILVTRGLVEAATSEDMLAAIIAHELAHIILRHGISMIDDMKINEEIAAVARQAAAFAGSGNPGAQRALAMRNSVSGIIDTMLKNGYSRPQEFEADKSAVALLAAAGYDPNAMVHILRILQQLQSGQSGGFNSTHPSPAERLANVGSPSLLYRVPDTRSYRSSRFINK